ncbi:NAD(P)-dependent oxidoreductase, partial [Clostridioides difficile]
GDYRWIAELLGTEVRSITVGVIGTGKIGATSAKLFKGLGANVPIGNILLASDNIGLTGLWFENQKYYAYNLDQEHQEKELPIFE